MCVVRGDHVGLGWDRASHRQGLQACVSVSAPDQGHFFDIFDPHPPTTTPHDASKKWVSSGGGGSWGGQDRKFIEGCVYWTE